MPIKANVDFKGAIDGLNKLVGPVRTSLARSMAVAGGQMLRDEAKARCPVGGDMSTATRNAGESSRPGLLRDSIYLAFKDGQSTPEKAVYSVSWNHKMAPHGHLVEFGHWQIYKVYRAKNGEWYTNMKAKLAEPRWIAAHPFLRPALDAKGEAAMAAMVARGRERLPELLRGDDGT